VMRKNWEQKGKGGKIKDEQNREIMKRLEGIRKGFEDAFQAVYDQQLEIIYFYEELLCD
jgi:hypothetical protein